MSASKQALRLLTLEMWVWARILPLRVAGRDLEGIIALAEAAPVARYGGLESQAVTSRIARLTRHPWFMRDRRCLRQGLLGYRFLTMAGHRPALHFGIAEASLAASRVEAHCWVELDGTAVVNDCLAGMQRIHMHQAARA